MTDTERLDWLEKNCGLSITRYRNHPQDPAKFEIETYDEFFDTGAETLRDAIDDAISVQANDQVQPCREAASAATLC